MDKPSCLRSRCPAVGQRSQSGLCPDEHGHVLETNHEASLYHTAVGVATYNPCQEKAIRQKGDEVALEKGGGEE